MNLFIRDGYRGRPGYVALVLLVLAYAAALAMVIAPDRVMQALDARGAAVWDRQDTGAGGFYD
ncbi:hypothetical protein [Paragemmobacter ruber]|uniref:ABC transporter permease n=1 Tax=Paragemmobacter ruber TaxID=1985673 RepID=A0ABW9Y807_9RHOB|nr:hypothetical protein [Rhodobacter ruber]NBE08324.1 hypothetical protein [Rhodobacter ruber]